LNFNLIRINDQKNDSERPINARAIQRSIAEWADALFPQDIELRSPDEFSWKAPLLERKTIHLSVGRQLMSLKTAGCIAISFSKNG